MQSQNQPETDEKRAACRAFLRERFLRCISGLVGSPCKITTVENTTITAHYHGMDMHGQDIFVKNLTTPMGQLRYALVRSMDVVNMNLNSANIKPKQINE
ncbi:Gem-associated protein 7 (Gemin7) [Nesidiocoris tenuis]|nr:Gem-associated protein 7 (Gemin7) [Nesidiocoris tenuis]